MSYAIPGDLVTVKYWHLKQKCVISIPGIYLSSFIYLDDPIQTTYKILIIEPTSNTPTILETTKFKPVSCH